MTTRRRGTMFLEVLAATVLLAALAAVCVQFVAATAVQRRAERQREIANQEAANIMERLTAESWSALTPGPCDMPLSEEVQQPLPGGVAEILIDETSGTPEAKRIVVTVHWQDRAGGAAQSVRLVAWRYREAGT
jgi:hypothetical protein